MGPVLTDPRLPTDEMTTHWRAQVRHPRLARTAAVMIWFAAAWLIIPSLLLRHDERSRHR